MDPGILTKEHRTLAIASFMFLKEKIRCEIKGWEFDNDRKMVVNKRRRCGIPHSIYIGCTNNIRHKGELDA